MFICLHIDSAVFVTAFLKTLYSFVDILSCFSLEDWDSFKMKPFLNLHQTINNKENQQLIHIIK